MTAKKVRTVLLVDDDAAVVAVLTQALTEIGYRVLSAGDGQEALDRHNHRSQAIDLLITDLEMPFLNGKELAQRLLHDQPDLPIVFISGDPEAESLPDLSAFAHHLFLQKPFMPSELVERLECLFSS